MDSVLLTAMNVVAGVAAATALPLLPLQNATEAVTASTLIPILGVIVGVAGVVVTLVGPLYYLVLDMRSDSGVATQERSDLGDTQDDLRSDLGELTQEVRALREEMNQELHELRVDVRENAQRSERNQEHIHEMLVGRDHGDDDDVGNPHYTPDYCPLPERCSFHNDDD